MLRLLPLVLLCACRTVTPAAPPPSAKWEVPIVWEGDGHRSALPLVAATIGGKPTLLLLDTGAPETTLQAWFVKSLELEPTDFEGHRVAELPLQLGTGSTTAKWSLVDTDPALRELGVGGTLSPQHALAKGAVAIDFPANRLLALDGNPNAWLRWLDERSPRGQVEAQPRVAPFDGRVHLKSRVGDGREVSTALATAQEFSSYEPALFDAGLVKNGHVAGLHLKVGESEFGPLEIAVQPAETGAQGRLGLDVLKQLVLLIPVHEMHPLWVMTPRE